MWLVNANVVDVLTGEKLRDRAVHVGTDGRIVEVATAPPVGESDSAVVDVAGRWLLPGLISCHTHLSVVFPFSDTDEQEDPALTAYRSAARAHQALQAGITTIRCVHEQNQADLSLRRAAARGWIKVPRIRGAGRAISTVGGHGEGAAAIYATGEEEFYRTAAAEIEAGADHIKIFITGGLAKKGENYDTPEMADGEIRGVVRAAHEHHKYVVAHSGDSVAIKQALAQGVTSFEHAYRLDEQTAAMLVGPNIFVTPTLCVTRSESWMRANHFEEHSIQQALAAADDHLLSVQRAIRAGVTLINGTDYPPGDLVDGVPAAVHEMLLMAGAGLTPLQALQSISSQAARLLRIDDHVGQIRPGYVGDLIAVEGDPLADLEVLRDILLVVQGGEVIRGNTVAGMRSSR